MFDVRPTEYPSQAIVQRRSPRVMPDEKLIRLCESISKETDPAKMTALLDELIKLLGEEQDAIRAKINANLKKNSLL
jgi:hypothetical protein